MKLHMPNLLPLLLLLLLAKLRPVSPLSLSVNGTLVGGLADGNAAGIVNLPALGAGLGAAGNGSGSSSLPGGASQPGGAGAGAQSNSEPSGNSGGGGSLGANAGGSTGSSSGVGSGNNSALMQAPKEKLYEKCTGPGDPGPCKQYIYKWRYEPTTSECTTFIWGGCDGNPQNRFSTEAECLFHCIGGPRKRIT